MPIAGSEACKKRKRKSMVFSFNTFCDPGYPVNPTGPFRDNIRLFVQECGELEDYEVNGMPVWCTFLSHEKNKGVVVPLFTVEEDVKYSSQPFCDHCRCSGWSHHFVSNRKYHLIIPVDAEWNKPLKDTALDTQSHLLHGLIHCNGYGHLVSINGIDGGSKFLCGREIMDLWDRICTNLHARKVTVEDVAKKRSMDLRLLHGIAYGHPWFGKWGYRFLQGSFGVSEHHYERAIEVLGSLSLDNILGDFSISSNFTKISEIIRYYKDLSETNLITIRDLLRLMLTLKSSAPKLRKLILVKSVSPTRRPPPENKLPIKEKTMKARKFENVVATMDSRWPARRLEYAAQVVVDALKEHCNSGRGGMPRQEVRDAARLHIGDTGLLDYVLKSMNNVIVGNHVVRRSINPDHRVLEYSIQGLSSGDGEYSSAASRQAPAPSVNQVPVSKPAAHTGPDVYNDLIFLYNNVLLSYPQSSMPGLAKQAILDSKRFVKEWPFRDENDQLLRFICRILPSSIELDEELSKKFFPGEMVVVPLHATIGELKLAAERALRDTYCIAEKYVVNELGNMEGLGDDEVVFGAIESGSDIWTLGSGISMKSELKCEGGPEKWTVRCECGATDDDGERMVSCDICEVWQHTRCSGIDDSCAVPPLFLCQKCCCSLAPQREETTYGYEYDTRAAGEPFILPSEYGFWEEADAAFVI